MPEEMNTETVETKSTDDSSAAPKNQVSALLAEVSVRISESGPEVSDKLKTLLVSREISDRVALLDDGLKKKLEADRAIKKIKPDVVTFNLDGTKNTETYSQAKIKELTEAKEKATKLDKALNLAFEKNDYSKLKELK